jgi:hypothetical protein
MIRILIKILTAGPLLRYLNAALAAFGALTAGGAATGRAGRGQSPT